MAFLAAQESRRLRVRGGWRESVPVFAATGATSRDLRLCCRESDSPWRPGGARDRREGALALPCRSRPRSGCIRSRCAVSCGWRSNRRRRAGCSRLYLRFTGMILSRTSSVAPWREMASRLWSGSSASLRICGARPLVETVMWRAPISRPQGALMIRMARTTFSKFASGSPMPMKTTLSIRSPLAFSTARSCCTISLASRLRENPSSPLAQNLQP